MELEVEDLAVVVTEVPDPGETSPAAFALGGAVHEANLVVIEDPPDVAPEVAVLVVSNLAGVVLGVVVPNRSCPVVNVLAGTGLVGTDLAEFDPVAAVLVAAVPAAFHPAAAALAAIVLAETNPVATALEAADLAGSKPGVVDLVVVPDETGPAATVLTDLAAVVPAGADPAVAVFAEVVPVETNPAAAGLAVVHVAMRLHRRCFLPSQDSLYSPSKVRVGGSVL